LEKGECMSAGDKLVARGTVLVMHRGPVFDVKLDNGHVTRCYPSGKMQMHHITIMPGDCVDVDLDVYDFSKGRIVFRHK
jgi:translation initiation factor IF-1